MMLQSRGDGVAISGDDVNRTRFAQISMNFASNAIKYNRPGGAVFV
jgi:signal transduction histidine kinase